MRPISSGLGDAIFRPMRIGENGGSVVPYFVARFSALPVDVVEALSAPQLIAAIEDVETAARRIVAERENLSEQMHAEISVIQDRPVRNRLIELRRELYNGRSISDARLAAVRALSAETQQIVAILRDLLARHEGATEALRVAYADALVSNRQVMRVALQDEPFRNGLLLSSSALYRNVPRYLHAQLDHTGSRDEQIERGLLRYLTRTAMKATPFATLCAIVPGRLDDATPGCTVLTVEGELHTRRSVVRLNKRIHRALWERMKRCECVRRSLIVEPNPTACRADSHWIFLGHRNGREGIERVACDPLPDRVLSMLADAPLTLGALRDGLDKLYDMRAMERNLSMELDALLEVGFVRFRNPVPEQTVDWDVLFGALLANMNDDDARIAHALTADLRRLAERYAAAPFNHRAEIVDGMRGTLDGAFAALGIETPLADAVVFEDLTADATLVVSRSTGVQDALHRAAEWISALGLLAPACTDRMAMRHFFDLRFEAAAAGISLLRFHEVFEREHLRAHREREERIWRGAGDVSDAELAENPFQLDDVRRVYAASDRVMESFRSGWAATPDASEIDLTPEALVQAIGDLGLAPSCLSSMSLFGQVIGMADDDSAARIVSAKDHYPIGFGKFLSRFLHVMPAGMQQDVRSDNARLAGNDIVLAELCADAFFNVNLHPPLLPAEIDYPVVDGNGSVARLSVADLDVVRDPDDAHSLRLVHRSTGKQVIPVDFGFVSLQRRPPLYQLMARFCPAGDAYAPLPEQLVVFAPDVAPCVQYRPRFTYARRVVVSRRRWIVPRALFPYRGTGEADVDYFVRVRRWRVEHHIDEQVFAVVRPEPGADTGGHEGSSRDWRKPQYIDFTSPLLVALFGKLPGNLTRFTLELQERYPDAANLPTYAGQRYASEIVLQFNRPASKTQCADFLMHYLAKCRC